MVDGSLDYIFCPGHILDVDNVQDYLRSWGFLQDESFRFLQSALRTCGETEDGSSTGEDDRSCLPDATRSSGDEDDLTLERFVHEVRRSVYGWVDAEGARLGEYLLLEDKAGAYSWR